MEFFDFDLLYLERVTIISYGKVREGLLKQGNVS